MKDNYTHISIVLDRSGSMSSVTDDVIGGFNEFLKVQKKEPGECTLSMIQFDTEYEVLHDFIKLDDAPNLTNKTFVPRGMTALLDAIGKTINVTGEKLSNLKEEDRPSKVIFVIQTDGEENSSREFTNEKINEMIKHQKENYNWLFIFLGADQDAIASANSLGICSTNTFGYTNTAVGNATLYNSVNTAIGNARLMSTKDYTSVTTGHVDLFTKEDREKEKLMTNLP